MAETEEKVVVNWKDDNGNPVVIERSGVTVNVIEAKKKGTEDVYPLMDSSVLSDEDVIAFIGVKTVRKILDSKFKAKSQQFFEAAKDEDTHEFDLDEFIKYSQAFGSAGETIAEINKAIEGLIAKMEDLDFDTAEGIVKAKELRTEIVQLKKDKLARSRKGEAAKDAAKATATAWIF